MNTVVKIDPKDIDAIAFQEASLDIWDKKYRLTAKDGAPIDKTMDDTYQRVARALADVEKDEVREHWYERFLWALRRGAIPAGRVISNAGALEHKPATSTINCTVSGTIHDSMDDILKKVHEAGLTLKAGCGLGYEHSTLRPRGAYVSGAGAYTSGPLSFMDIFDKMCFTVSSAGGRRGAQMGTFDVGHPDVMEFIRATNPCVTSDTRLATRYGLVRIGDLYDAGVEIQATVDRRALDEGMGVAVRSAVPAFMTAPSADVYRVVTKAGYEIKATEWHDVYTTRGKVKLKDLKVGDELLVQSGKGQFGGCGSEELGALLGLITGDGHFTNRGKGKNAAVVNLWGEDRDYAQEVVGYINSLITGWADTRRQYRVSAVAVAKRNLIMIRSVILTRVLEYYGFTAQAKSHVPEIVWRGNEHCVRGYLRGLFQTDGTVQRDDKNAYCTIRLASSQPSLLKDVQMLLANFGILCRICKRREAGQRLMPDGKGGGKLYDCKADYELIIGSQSRDLFMEEIGFITDAKNAKYQAWREQRKSIHTEEFVSAIARIEHVGKEAVFDTTQEDHNTLIFNGLVTGNCGEQPLPPYGSCLLGSVNLTRFVKHPFTDFAEFDWSEYREVVKVFTRMLDNVVEVNGLPLEKQREEIVRKRRHGMGFLGLGSTLALLRMKYGSPEAVRFTEDVTREMAVAGWEAALELSREKGPAPIMNEEFTVTKEMLRKRPEMASDGWQA